MIRLLSCLMLAFFLGAGIGFAADPAPGRDLSDQDLTKFDYTGAKLENATFERSILEFAIFVDCKMAGAILRKTHCRSATFKRADMTGVDMSGAEAQNAGFDDVNLSKAILDNVNLEGAGFYVTKFVGASLKNSKGPSSLTKCDFTDADLRGADFSLSKDYGPKSAIYKGAKYDNRTKFPVGVDPDAVGAVFVKEDNPKALGAGKSALGTPVRYYKALLYFTPTVTKAEAIKLGDLLVLEKMMEFGTGEQRVQLNKAGKIYQVRVATSAVNEEGLGDEFIAKAQKIFDKMAEALYSPTTLEFHLCDVRFKTIKVLKAEETPPDTRPEAKPVPDPADKPEPKSAPREKPEPKAEPANPEPAKPEPAQVEPKETEYGTELKYRKATLYYTKKVTKAEAVKLGKFLVDELNFGRTTLAFQLNRTGSIIELRMPVKSGRENDAQHQADCKELGKLVATKVFPSDAVEIHVCDEALKTLKVIKPE